MAIGDVTGPEGRVFQDPDTGATIHQLTDHRAHSNHLYFTNMERWDGGRRLLIGSHRHNAPDFYSVELATGTLTQLTDFASDESPGLLTAFVSPVRDEAYFTFSGQVRALDLRTGQQRVLFEAPDGYRSGNLSCTADGNTVCHVCQQQYTGPARMDLGHGYVGFAEYSAWRPHCRIVAIPVDGGAARTVHDEKFWLGHINTSPALPDMLTFCHEGPWETIDQRMWALNIRSGQVYPLRAQVAGESIGHEYWFADGHRVGYHGRNADGVHVFGFVHWDNTGKQEFPFPFGSMHFHSLDETLIVGDGTARERSLLLWKLDGDRYLGPRRLLRHRGSWHTQLVHVHPRMFGDGDRLRICYTADPQGYGNVYIADVPDFESLPEVEA